MPREVVPIFTRRGSIFGGEFDHAMVGQDHMRAIADEQAAIDLYAGLAQGRDFLEEGHGIEHNAVADHAAASDAQHAAGHQLQDEFLAIDDDGMAGIVSSGIARHDGDLFGEDVDDLAPCPHRPTGRLR